MIANSCSSIIKSAVENHLAGALSLAPVSASHFPVCVLIYLLTHAALSSSQSGVSPSRLCDPFLCSLAPKLLLRLL